MDFGLIRTDPHSTSGYFGRLWQVGRIVIENNVIELIPTPTNLGPPSGIVLGYPNFSVPPTFRQVVIRGNIIRGLAGPSDASDAISLYGCGDLIVENNVIESTSATPLKFSFCGNVRFFNNRTPGGSLIQGYDSGVMKKADDLGSDIEDSSVLAF